MERRVVDDREREVCPSCGFIFYRNPVPAVGVVVALEGKLVLVRRRYEPRAGCWALPAGFMELGESAEDAAIRECHEETGLLVRVDHLLGVYSYGEGQRTGLLIIYAATATGGELVAADDATEAGVFAPDALPAPMAFPTHLQAIDRWRRETRAASAPYLAQSAGGAISVRYASQPDAPAALALLLADRPSDNAAYIAAEALLHDRLHDPDRPALLAEIDGAIGGVALLGLHQAPRGWYATLDDLVVAPAQRRRGAGSALIEAAARLARGRGCALLQLAFPVENAAARAFLDACGFGTDQALMLRL
jgi:ADP-ribose pyrophosphatase YjhB (NUDIX family)/N-acetylglutamate synthase-like GNAT family acetyltransferase